MSAKKVTKTDIVFDDTKIILRSVFNKADIKYYIQPCKDKYGHFPPCVKRVDSNDNMIMSEAEKNDFSEGKIALFKENETFVITSGKVYDLTDMWQKAEWEAIKNCPLIAKSRQEKNEKGINVIDGTAAVGAKPGRSGIAELYIDRPGLETKLRVDRKQLIFKAQSFIYNDERGSEGRLNMAKILGRNMNNLPDADVLDYLLSVAETNPNKIIDLYTGDDISLRLLFIEAKNKKVIYIKNKLYLYGDNIALGATDDAVIAWMKEPRNIKVLELIKKDTYPDYITIDE